MPKITSTPTASSDRTRLSAPVMPVAGSGAAAATDRAEVSTPARALAASRVGASRPAVSLGVVVISAFSWALLGESGSSGNKKPLVPQARRGQRVGRRTGALGEYEAARAAGNGQVGARHLHTVRLTRRDVKQRVPLCGHACPF